MKTTFHRSEKLLIFRQTAPFLFRPDQWSLNPTDPSQENFSILNRMESFRWGDDTFRFEMLWPRSHHHERYEWIQSSNPLNNSTKVVGYKSLHVPSKNLKRQGGLKRSDNSLLHTELWRCVIGSFEMFQGGIATCNSKSQPQVELYAYLPPDPSDPVVNGDMILVTLGIIVFLGVCSMLLFLWNWISHSRPLRQRYLSANALYEIFSTERERHKALMDESDEFETAPHAQMFSPWLSEFEASKLESDIMAYVVDGALTHRLLAADSEDSFGGSTISSETRPPTAFQELKRKRREKIRQMLSQVASSCNSSNSDVVFVEGSFQAQIPLDFPDIATKTGSYFTNTEGSFRVPLNFPDATTQTGAYFIDTESTYTDRELDSAISKYTDHKIRFSRDPGSSTWLCFHHICGKSRKNESEYTDSTSGDTTTESETSDIEELKAIQNSTNYNLSCGNHEPKKQVQNHYLSKTDLRRALLDHRRGDHDIQQKRRKYRSNINHNIFGPGEANTGVEIGTYNSSSNLCILFTVMVILKVSLAHYHEKKSSRENFTKVIIVWRERKCSRGPCSKLR